MSLPDYPLSQAPSPRRRHPRGPGPGARLSRWLFSWRTLRRGLIGLAGFATLVAVAYTVENWRGRRAWEQYRRELEGKGERLDLVSFLPKPAPPEQNFATTPFLAPLTDYEFVEGTIRWRDSNAVARAESLSIYEGGDHDAKEPPLPGDWQQGVFCDLKEWQAFFQGGTKATARPPAQDAARDVILALRRHEPLLAELRAASQRPYAVFAASDQGAAFGPLKHLKVLRTAAKISALRAEAHLEAGQGAEALADVQLAFGCARALQSEPTVIALLIRMLTIEASSQPVWEGLARHRWTDAQLDALQQTLGSVQLLADYGRAMRAERAIELQTVGDHFASDSSRRSKSFKIVCDLIPNGWHYQNQLTVGRLFTEKLLDPVDAGQRRVYPEKFDGSLVRPKLTPYNFIAWTLLPKLSGKGLELARAQTGVDLAFVACALERHRLALGQYPETLAALAPRFAAQLPNDVLTGQPYEYRRTDDGQFLLYSVGWNQTDDGGTVAMTRDQVPRVDSSRSDWVWRLPAQ